MGCLLYLNLHLICEYCVVFLNTVLVDHVAVENRLQGRVTVQNRYEYGHRHCRRELLLVTVHGSISNLRLET